ncbi:hypothetical protein LCGC14_0663980 [marine sediment metagenome]|uniref:Uncharacterized protein n=1 Tax=marine sediment metagenome TaxID=412755 RepID=A0A0F9QXX7_9ZZZZ|nr:hypothetical protein [bacterium]
MVESLPPNKLMSLGLNNKIEGYYMEENPRSLLIRLSDGRKFWVPKRFIDSEFLRKKNIKQEFIIENWILRKIGFI